MKGPINFKDVKVGKPDLGGITVEVWINTLRAQVDALRKELDKAKKDIASLQTAAKNHAAVIVQQGKQAKAQDSKIAAIESKSAAVAEHVHDYTFPQVVASDVFFPDGDGHRQQASLVGVQNITAQTLPPK